MLDATATLNRPATVRVANDLARPSGRRARPGHAGLGRELRTYRSLTLPTHVAVTRGHRLPSTALFTFIVVIEELAFRAGDPSAAVAVGLEAVLADQRANPRRFQLDRVERVETCELDVEPGAGMAVEQRH